MKKLLLLAAVSFFAACLHAQQRWVTDPMHSFVRFSVKHLGISFVEGSFKKFEGEYTAVKDDLSDITTSFSVDVSSISTGVEQRDTHLKSADFFDADQYPVMRFTSSSFKKVSGNKYTLTGQLTIKDVTKTVKFDVEYGGRANDNSGAIRSGFTARTKINRLDYGISYDTGGTTIAKDVAIVLHLEFVEAR